MGRTRRRRFLRGGLALVGLGLLSGCGALSPPAPPPARVPRIGLLLPGPRSAFASRTEAFRRGLAELGHVEGHSVVIEYRYAEGGLDGLGELASELIRLGVDVIVSAGQGVRVAAGATGTIPIVFSGITDPVGTGLVSSLARPGGNVTGLTNFSEAIDGKRLDLLKEAFPAAGRVAHLWYAQSPAPGQLRITARALGLELRTVDVRGPDDFDRAFATAVAERAQALIETPSPLFITHQRRILDFAARSRLPAIYSTRDFADSGGLMAYAPSAFESFRLAAAYVDKILKGARPAELPVAQPTTFDFIVNRKTAHALGLAIPPSVLQQATDVIQ